MQKHCKLIRLISEEKFMEERISHVERNFSSLAKNMGGIVRRTARLRDKGDKVVKTLQDFSVTEVGGMKKHLEGLSACFSAIEDFNQLKVCTDYLC